MVRPDSQMPRPLLGVMLGGFAAATFDIIYACVRNAGFGRSPTWVLQSVASGWQGKEAFDGGIASAALGLGSHYFILLVAALIYLRVSARVPALRTRAVAFGALFGVLVYLFMNFVVLPLSAFPFKLSYPAMRLIEGFASHALFVGIPIAMAIRRFAGPARGGVNVPE